ncbi:MAG: 2-C-methyl-D-erythritol 4-phosphate cytidylyltransferase [Candidatus Zixiibacteriota bacterium]
MKKTIAIIVAGGVGERFGGDIPKQYQLIAGRPLLAWTIERFERSKLIDEIAIVTAEDYLLYVNNQIVNKYEFKKVVKIVPGGQNRTESVYKGLESLPLSTGFVAVHDAVRPLVKSGDIDAVVAEAQAHRAAILGRPVSETVKRVRDAMILATVDRDNLFLAETPQVFQYDLLKEAYKKGMAENRPMTDDAAMVEAYGFKVKLVQSTGPNPKLTTQDDWDFIRMMLERESGGI